MTTNPNPDQTATVPPPMSRAAKAEALLLRFAAEAHRRKWSYDRGLDGDGVPVKSEAFDALHRLGEEMRVALEELRRTPSAVSVVPPATNQTALREQIVEALLTTRRTDYEGAARHGEHRYDARCALCAGDVDALTDAVLAVLPAPVDRAAVLRWAADLAESLRQFEPATGARKSAQVSENVGILRVATELRRRATCPWCESGTEHDVHCPTPVTHNWGCGCPSDVAAAIASCPGYEMSPSPCRCPCEGCKHHCGAHDPQPAVASCVAAEAPHAETPDARPRCPHCQMPHDLTPGSLPVAVCASTRHRIAEDERLHPQGDHSLCCRVDCDAITAPAVVAQPGKETAAEDPPVVAYRSSDGRSLYCTADAGELFGLGYEPVTSEDLPDGGICTYPNCGVDVLIPQAPQ